jgi:AcrR family transcriptional regulator
MTTSDRTRRRPAEDAEERRAQIERLSAELFSEKGYHATTMRDIATHVGVRTASLYYHFDTKQTILLSIMEATMASLHEGIDAALASSEDPIEQMREAVTQHVRYHAERPIEAIIGDTELRSLSGEDRSRMQQRRDAYQAKFEEIVRRGGAAGAFRVPDDKLAVYSVLNMCTGVAAWFRADGRLSVPEVAEVFAELVLQLLGVNRA